MKNTILITIILLFTYCDQEKTEKSSLPVQPDLKAEHDTIINTSFTATNGERFLRFELLVNRSLKDTWKYFGTEEGMKVWMAPVVKLDLKVGGIAQTHYDSTAKIGDKGTIPLKIINYIPHELITYKVELNDVFTEKCQNEDQDLQEIIQFDSLDISQTKIISTMIGWGNGKEWNNTYKFFEAGNKWTYEQLLKQIKRK